MQNNKPIILIVDEDNESQMSIKTIFNADYLTTAVSSGTEGLALVENIKPDLIVYSTDNKDMDAYQFLDMKSKLQKTYYLPVIFVASNFNENHQAEALERGAVDYIEKPIKPLILLSRVKLQIELNKYRNNLQAQAELQTSELRKAYNDLNKLEGLTLSLLENLINFRERNVSTTSTDYLEGYMELFLEALAASSAPGYELTEAQITDILKSSKLHDIGMIGISDDILIKSGKLSEYEFDLARNHTQMGAKMLKETMEDLEQASFLNVAYDIALTHHEKWDGGGYPNQLKHDEIPLSGRIMALIDVYDVLISSREYSDKSHKQAVRLIEQGCGINFDPYLVEVFVANSEKFEEFNRNKRIDGEYTQIS